MMPFIRLSACFIALFFVTRLGATTWLVGPGKPHTSPSQVAALVADGDTVAIDPGVYPGDVCTWTANHLVLRGTGAPGQYSHLRADGQHAGGKAIWVIKGDHVVVENIEFSLCQVPDQNGAGIRAEGLHLTVRHCSFHHNEMGILTTNDDNAEFIIEYSEFAYNGYGDGYSHNVYVGSVNLLIFRYNYSHHGKVGHLLKSRAKTNYILYNRLTDEPGADASREIDLPNGGLAIIMGNLIQQSQESQNGNIVGYGMEGLANQPPHALYMVHNTMVNQRFAGRFVQFPAGLDQFVFKNNLLAGPGSVMDAGALPTVWDTTNNVLVADVAAAGLANYPDFDYQLVDTAPGIDGAVDAGWADTFLLQPVAVYTHPNGWAPRVASGPSDLGAYEFQHPVGSKETPVEMAVLQIFPNPASGEVRFTLPFPVPNGSARFDFFNTAGQLLTSTSRQITGNDRVYAVSLPGGLPGTVVVQATFADGRKATAMVQVVK